MGGDGGGVRELGGAELGAGGEVVAQAHAVAHLVGDGLDDVLVDEPLLLLGREGRGHGGEGLQAVRAVHRPEGRQLAATRVGLLAGRVGLRAGVGAGIEDAVEAHVRLGGERAVHVDAGVEDLAGHGVRPEEGDGEGHPGGPADDVVAQVRDVPVGVVGHLVDDDGVLEADPLEGLVVGQRALADGGAVLLGGRVVDPEDDGFDRLGDGGVGVLLDEVPALDEVDVGIGLARVGDVVVVDGEVADARVAEAGLVAALGQFGEVVGDGPRHGLGAAVRAGPVQGVDRPDDDVLGKVLDRVHGGRHGIDHVAAERLRDVADVRPEEAGDVDKDALALGLSGLDLEGVEDAVGEGALDGAHRLGIVRPVAQIGLDELDLRVALGLEPEGEVGDGHPVVDAARGGVPQTAPGGDLEKHQLAEPGLGDLEKDLVRRALRLAVDGEEPRHLGELLGDLVDRLRLLRLRRLGRGRRGGRLGGGRLDLGLGPGWGRRLGLPQCGRGEDRGGERLTSEHGDHCKGTCAYRD